MSRLLLLALAPAAIAAPAMAQDHSGHVMPATPAPAASAPPTSSPSAVQDHSGHVIAPAQIAAPSVASDPNAGHGVMGQATGQSMDQSMEQDGPPPVSDAAVALPDPPTDHAADAVWGTGAMARSRAILDHEHGGMKVKQLRAETLEYAPRSGRDGYRWDLEGWWGGDLNRLVVRSEGEGAVSGKLDSAEVQVLYSRAFARYTDLQAGVRQDVGPGPSRTYLTAGFETLLPYWFEVEGATFVSDKGDVYGRLEGSYDLRLTQRLVLQPRAELELSAQKARRDDVGSGLTKGEFGLRLRYEIRREFAPYIGVLHERRFGGTADLARARGEDVRDTSLVVGLRAWF